MLSAKQKLRNSDQLKDTAESVLDKVYDSLHEQIDVLQDYYEDTRDLTRETTKKVKVFVEDHPFYSAVGAAVIGVALGMAARGDRFRDSAR